MLSLDPVSDGILFQCDGCRHVGEIYVEGVAEEGAVYCWKCLGRMRAEEIQRKIQRTQAAASKKERCLPLRKGNAGAVASSMNRSRSSWTRTARDFA